jgi:sugar-specific transcriptional regulator TrmB
MSLNLFNYLEQIGMSQKEISVYLYLLSIESSLPMMIAKETHLKRSTVYVVLDLLKAKGLVREIQKGKRCIYIAEDPERIKFLLEELKLQTEKNIQGLSIILPQLKATLRKSGQPPLIKFYEGESAVQTSMEELANNPRFRTEMDYGIFPLELIYKLFRSHNLKQYIDFRITDNKLFKIVYTSDEGKILVSDGQEAIRIDQKEFPLSCDISIFEDEVRVHMLGSTIYGILIKNPEFAQTLTSLFKLALKGSKSKD